MRVYFAGPLFCEAERVFNLRLAEKLEAKGYQVFLPQRDGVESEKPPYNKMPNARLANTACTRLGVHAAFFRHFLGSRLVPSKWRCLIPPQAGNASR